MAAGLFKGSADEVYLKTLYFVVEVYTAVDVDIGGEAFGLWMLRFTGYRLETKQGISSAGHTLV